MTPKTIFFRKICGIEEVKSKNNSISLKITEAKIKFKILKELKCLLRIKSLNQSDKNLILTKIEKLVNSMKHLRKKRNKSKRSSNGNIENIFKILQWNKGNFDLITKIEEL